MARNHRALLGQLGSDLRYVGAPQLHHSLEHCNPGRLAKRFEKAAFQGRNGGVNGTRAVESRGGHAANNTCICMHM
jgi:hypothetical protein